MTINLLSDAQLLRVFMASSKHIAKARRTNSIHLEQYQLDNDYIMAEVTKRLPQAYQWDLEQIAKGKTIPDKNILPGQYYKHKLVHILRLQIVDEFDFNGPLWSCRAFVAGVYVCRFIIRQSTILEWFDKHKA